MTNISKCLMGLGLALALVGCVMEDDSFLLKEETSGIEGEATAASAEPAKAPSDAVVIDPATADSETDGAKIDGPSGGSEIEPLWQSCLTQGSTGNIACFEDYGDKFYVYDGDADGASAAASWWTDYGRSGICYNSNGAGTWAECNYDMSEGGIVYWRTCYQNRSAGGGLYCTTTVMVRYINGD